MNFHPMCYHSSLLPHRVLRFTHSALLLHHWRLVNGLKRHSIGRCTPSRQGGLTFPGVGEMQFISAPDQLPAKRTSHPISRRWQHTQKKRKINNKKKTGGVGGGCMCVAQTEDGLVKREVLMDFRLVSQFLLTRERWWGMRQRGKTNAKYPIEGP